MSASPEVAVNAPAPSFAIPQVTFSSAPALEVRDLCDGRSVRQAEALEALATLGEGWRLETANELRALYNPAHTNQHGARTLDETLYPVDYWSADLHPLNPAARVVVWFDVGFVNVNVVYYRARARAVRVVGQSSGL